MIRLETARLSLVKTDAEVLGAWLAGDGRRLEQLTSARFREPVDAPPLFGEDLQRIHDAVAAGEDIAPWLFVSRGTKEPVGVGGVATVGDGVLMLGYSVWERHQGRGYATEAAKALCAYGFSLEGIRTIRATIPRGHVASERVAMAAGLVRVGDGYEEGVGPLGVWDALRPGS